MTEADVWTVELDPSTRAGSQELSLAERERAARLRGPAVRARWVAARLGLRRVLAHYVDADPADIELRLGSHGKPALADPGMALRFNLSHSGDLALIAVTGDLEVGVDVEERREGRDFLRLAEIGLSGSDATTVRDAPPGRRAGAFYAAWVRQEAVAKCLGVGLGGPLPDRPVAVVEVDAGRRHAAALAVAAGDAPTVRRRALQPA